MKWFSFTVLFTNCNEYFFYENRPFEKRPPHLPVEIKKIPLKKGPQGQGKDKESTKDSA